MFRLGRLLLPAFALSISPAIAQLTGAGWENCLKSEDKQLRIRGCSTVLSRGKNESNGNRIIALDNRGSAYAQTEQYELAVKDFSELLTIDSNNALALFKRGIAHNRLQKHKQAVDDLTRALLLGQNKFMTFLLRGGSYNSLGKYDLAILDLDEAIRLNPKSAGAFAWRGEAYWQLNQVEKATHDLNAALKIDPDYFFAQVLLATIAAQTEKKRLAEEEARQKVAKAAASAAESPPGPASRTPGVRMALVIGNGAYAKMPSLVNPANDARDMAAALRELDFEVSLVLDVGRVDMEEKLAAFARSARGADTALIFYAGHGLQHQGVNYLAPVDARLEDETDLRRLIQVKTVISDLLNSKSARILILDACRDNEAVVNLAANLPANRASAFRRGLAAEKAEGVLIAFSTQPDRLARDGPGRNSPFTAALLRYLPTRGIDIRLMLTRVRGEVLRNTGGEQRPEVSDSLDGELVLK